MDDQRVAAAWGRFIQGRQRSSRIIRRWRIGGIAASVLVCLGSWYLWLGSFGEMSVSSVTENIEPGASQAILLLSNGQEIDLGEQDSVRVLSDNNTNICLDGAMAVYNNQGIQKEVTYNMIRIPRGGEYHLVLSDGTKIWLNSQSTLRFPTVFQGEERRVELTGEAYFDVIPGEKRFVVETKGMDVRVLGTAFNVNAYDDEAVVRTTLVKGKVEIVSDGRTACVLTPGEQSIWNRSTEVVEVLKVNTSLYTRWKNGQFVFRNNTLEDIMRALARWYDMEYEFEDSNLRQIRFYGVLDRFEDVEGLLTQFEKTGKVKFEYHQKKVIIK